MALLRHSTCAAHFWHTAATAASTAPTAPADAHTTATTASTTAPTAHADPTRASTRGKLAERHGFVIILVVHIDCLGSAAPQDTPGDTTGGRIVACYLPLHALR